MPQTTRCQIIPRTLCLIFFQRKILLIKASNLKDWQGTLDPVGGHIEPEEDVIESAQREILEESGLSPTDTSLKGILHVTNFFSKNLLLFITSSTVDSDNLPITNHQEGTLTWINLDQLDQASIFPDLKPLLEAVQSTPLGHIFTGTSVWNSQHQLVSITINQH